MANPVERWLETFMCKQYADTFEAYGYKTLQSVCQLQLPQLQSMGVNQEHCGTILENISVLRQTMSVKNMMEQGYGGVDSILNPASKALVSVARNANTHRNDRVPSQYGYPHDGRGEPVPYMSPTADQSMSRGYHHLQGLPQPSMVGMNPYGAPHHPQMPHPEATYPPSSSHGHMYQGGGDMSHYSNSYQQMPPPSGGGYMNHPSYHGYYPPNQTMPSQPGSGHMGLPQPEQPMPQSPQQVADSILQMASSMSNAYSNNPSAYMTQMAQPRHHSPGMSQHINHPQIHSPPSGHNPYMMYGRHGQMGMQNRTSPISPMQQGCSPESCHSGQSLHDISPAPGPHPSSVPSVSSPSVHSMSSPPAFEPIHHSATLTPRPSMTSPRCTYDNQQSPSWGKSPTYAASQASTHGDHFSPNPMTMTSPSSKTSPGYSMCSVPPASPSGSSTYRDTEPTVGAQYVTTPSSSQFLSNPLQSLQKLVMLPESQVVDPKSVVNDGSISGDNCSKNDNGGEPVSPAVSPKPYTEGIVGPSSPCIDGKHCETLTGSSNTSTKNSAEYVSPCKDGKNCGSPPFCPDGFNCGSPPLNKSTKLCQAEEKVAESDCLETERYGASHNPERCKLSASDAILSDQVDKPRVAGPTCEEKGPSKGTLSPENTTNSAQDQCLQNATSCTMSETSKECSGNICTISVVADKKDISNNHDNIHDTVICRKKEKVKKGAAKHKIAQEKKSNSDSVALAGELLPSRSPKESGERVDSRIPLPPKKKRKKAKLLEEPSEKTSADSIMDAINVSSSVSEHVTLEKEDNTDSLASPTKVLPSPPSTICSSYNYSDISQSPEKSERKVVGTVSPHKDRTPDKPDLVRSKLEKQKQACTPTAVKDLKTDIESKVAQYDFIDDDEETNVAKSENDENVRKICWSKVQVPNKSESTEELSGNKKLKRRITYSRQNYLAKIENHTGINDLDVVLDNCDDNFRSTNGVSLHSSGHEINGTVLTRVNNTLTYGSHVASISARKQTVVHGLNQNPVKQAVAALELKPEKCIKLKKKKIRKTSADGLTEKDVHVEYAVVNGCNGMHTEPVEHVSDSPPKVKTLKRTKKHHISKKVANGDVEYRNEQDSELGIKENEKISDNFPLKKEESDGSTQNISKSQNTESKPCINQAANCGSDEDKTVTPSKAINAHTDNGPVKNTLPCKSAVSPSVKEKSKGKGIQQSPDKGLSENHTVTKVSQRKRKKSSSNSESAKKKTSPIINKANTHSESESKPSPKKTETLPNYETVKGQTEDLTPVKSEKVTPTAAEQTSGGSSVTPTSSGKKRGRPVGSKNRFKTQRKKSKQADDEDDTGPLKLLKLRRTLDFVTGKGDKTSRHFESGPKGKRAKLKEPVKKRQGPYIKLVGNKDNPSQIQVINTGDNDTEKAEPVEKPAMPVMSGLDEKIPFLCSLCGKESNYRNMGDLFGPYFSDKQNRDPVSPNAEKRCKKNAESNSKYKDVAGHSRNKGASSQGKRRKQSSESWEPGEFWVHEDCAVWSHGVYLQGSKVHGLEEASSIARQTTCTACKATGATLGCFNKGCSVKFHYLCAKDRDCLLDEENFSLLCAKHKGRKIKSQAHSVE